MNDFRKRIALTDTHRLAPIGEGCALASALSSLVFVFTIGFYDLYRDPISIYSSIAAGGSGAAAGVLSIAAVVVLALLTAIRFVRFVQGKSARDSLYFCYAAYFSYLAAIALTGACCAGEALVLNEATIAGIVLGGAGVLASFVLFMLAKGGKCSKPSVMRVLFAALALMLLLAAFALAAIGPVQTNSGSIVAGYTALFARLQALQAAGEAVGGLYALAAFAFLFTLAFAACGVLLAERLAGNIAQFRKPTLLRGLLTAACGLAAAGCSLELMLGYAELAGVLATYTVPIAAMFLCIVLGAVVGADAALAQKLDKK